MSQAFDDLEQQVSDNTDSLGDVSISVDDHENRIGEVENMTSDIDPTRINQLNNPLDQDTIDLINAVIPNGTVTLSGGTATITDNRIGSNTSLMYSVKTSNVGNVIAVGNAHIGYTWTQSGNTITITSTIGTDASTIFYQLISTQ